MRTMGHVDSQALHNSTDMLCKMVAQLMRMLCAQWITSIRMLCRIRLTCFQLMRGYLHNCRAQFARAYLKTSDTIDSAHIQQVGSVEKVSTMLSMLARSPSHWFFRMTLSNSPPVMNALSIWHCTNEQPEKEKVARNSSVSV
jgi:hypothetical protein